MLIPAPTQKHAMDWSLALISQGIECRIDLSPEGQWSLQVEPDLEDRALDVLAKYSADQKRWLWQQQLAGDRFIFDWAALAWLAIIAVFYLGSESAPVFKTRGAMSIAGFSAGEWWRPFTAIWLHADPGHLAANASIGVALVGLVMGLYGTGNGLLLVGLSGIGGNLIEWLIMSPPRESLGASGAVMGCIGLLAAHTLTHMTSAVTRLPGAGSDIPLTPPQGTSSPSARMPWRQSLRPLLTSLGAGALLFILLGLGPGTDIVAHAGGFISGILLGLMASALRLPPQNVPANVLTGLLFLITVLVPWAAAFLKF